MSLAFLLLQYYDFHSSHSSYKNARICMNYAEGCTLVPFIISLRKLYSSILFVASFKKSLQFCGSLVCPETLVCNPILDSSLILQGT